MDRSVAAGSRARRLDAPVDQASDELPILTVVPRRLRRRRAGVAAAFLILSMFGVMLGLVAFQAHLAQGQLELDRLERQARTELQRYDQLRGEVAVLESPENIVAAARAQGMVQPSEVRYVSPPPEAVAAVAAASGRAGTDATPPGNASETSAWSTVKPIVGAMP